MTDKQVQAEAPHSNMEKDPSDWVTGDEAMTGAQMSYLKTLSEQAGSDFDETLTKAQASQQIEALQKETGRGTQHAESQSGAAAGHREEAPRPKVEAGASHASAKPTKVADDSADAQAEGDLFAEDGDGAKNAR